MSYTAVNMDVYRHFDRQISLYLDIYWVERILSHVVALILIVLRNLHAAFHIVSTSDNIIFINLDHEPNMDKFNKIAIYKLQIHVSTLPGHKFYFFLSDSMLVFQLHNFSISLKSISLFILNFDTISVVVNVICLLLMINCAKHFCTFWVDTFFINLFWEMLNCSPFHLFSPLSFSILSYHSCTYRYLCLV